MGRYTLFCPIQRLMHKYNQSVRHRLKDSYSNYSNCIPHKNIASLWSWSALEESITSGRNATIPTSTNLSTNRFLALFFGSYEVRRHHPCYCSLVLLRVVRVSACKILLPMIAGSVCLSLVPFTIFQYVFCTYTLDSLPENAKMTEVKVWSFVLYFNHIRYNTVTKPSHTNKCHI